MTQIPPFARMPVLSAVGAVAVVLATTAAAYGYHRDELYFRMLPPGWGHLDQPPLTPLIVRAISGVVDEPWAIRIPALLAACATVLVAAAIAREVGGARLAQGLAAWGTGFGVFTLCFGHVMLTASFDLLLWPAVLLVAMRAIRRDQPRWWLLAGALVGIGLYNKLLIVALLASIAVGLLLVGPRQVLRSGWLWAGVGVAVLVGAPNLIYQALNGLPQLAMGSALGEDNAAEVRVMMWPFLALLLGPLLVPTWVAGLASLVRRPAWRDLRWLVVAFVGVLAFTAVSGTQLYYPYGVLLCLFAVGCVPVAQWVGDRSARRALAVGAIAVNGAVAAVVALPLVPLDTLGDTPIADMNQLTADQVGWPEYADQVEDVVAGAGADVVIASNYGEAGALDRYGATVPVVSGHNALADLAAPPEDADVVVIVGGQYDGIAHLFTSCQVAAELDNGYGVDNEEQGEPIAVCTGPVGPWSELWPQIAHMD